MSEYDIVFDSDNIVYVKLSENLIGDYLKMVNDPNVVKMISKKNRIYTYEQELEWVKKNWLKMPAYFL